MLIKFSFLSIADSGKYPAFFGNITEFFKVLDTDDNSMLVGAR